MAYSVDWSAKIINIPQSDLVDLGGGVYKLDLESCHQELRRLEWEFFEGLSQPQIMQYVPPLEAGGVIYARFVLLMNGYTVTFEDGQYAVNLVGANTNIHDFTNVNQVSIRPTNSAGLQDLSTLLSSAYQGKVVVDPINGQAGTAVPIGTLGTPCDNVTDAVTIAHREGLDTLFFIGNYLVQENVSNLILRGSSSILTTLMVMDVANVQNCKFQDCRVTGILDGNCLVSHAVIEDLTYFNGLVEDSEIQGHVYLGGNAQAKFSRCSMYSFADIPPVIDMGGSGQDCMLVDYTGHIRFENLNGASNRIGASVTGGKVIIGADCIDGFIGSSGTGIMVVEDGATAMIDDQLLNKPEIATAVMRYSR